MTRQIEAEKRLEEQKQKQKIFELQKREIISLKNTSKDYNRERAKRKHDYQIEKMQEKLEMDKLRHTAMVTERQNLKQIRVQALFESEIQREDIRNALYHMSVWNTFDPKIIQSIVGENPNASNSRMH